MDKNSLNKAIEKIMKNKKVAPLIILLLVVLLVYFALSYFIDVNNISKNEKPKEPLAIVSGDEETITREDYEKEQKKELETILGQIVGVGEVNVKLTFEGSEEKVPAVNNKKQVSNTEETDSAGSKKNTKQETEDNQVVTTSGAKGDEPLILKTSKPKVIGVMITAEGAEDQKIRYDIRKAVASLYDISLEKVSVFPMEEKK